MSVLSFKDLHLSLFVMMKVTRELIKPLKPTDPDGESVGIDSCCADKHCQNPQNFVSNSSGDPKVSKHTKYVSLNFGEIV